MEEKKEDTSSQEMLKADRYLWIARAFSAVAVLAMVANVLLFAAIGSLYPLVRIQPFYLKVLDKNQQVIEIEPLSAKMMQSTDVVESMVRQYVLARFHFDSDIEEIEERASIDGIVALMSTQAVYDEFWQTQYNTDWMRERILKEGLKIKASIDTATALEADNYQWNVRLTLKQSTDSSVEDEEFHLVVNLTFQFDPLFRKAVRATWQDRLKNPLGFRVTNFGWKEEKK